MSACTAILMEVPDLPQNWMLVGPQTLQMNLKELGMVGAASLVTAGMKPPRPEEIRIHGRETQRAT